MGELFNLSIATGSYPDCLKIAEVIPIYKKGDPSKCNNYRLISLLSQFDKIFEKLLGNRLISFLEKYNLLSKQQFGFRQNSTTTYAIANIHDQILKNIDHNCYSCGLFLDLSKAFDTVDHQILLQKMHSHYGIRGKAFDIFQSFLTNRYQYVKILQCKSSRQKVSCGVPQGSSLGPILFLMYINDLPLASQFDTTLFADDTFLLLSDSSILNLERRVNEQLENIDKWFCINKLSLNYSKTNFMIFNKHPHKTCNYDFKLEINGNNLVRAGTVKYLGVIIDENLTWSQHLKYLSSPIAKHSGLFYRLRNYVSREALCVLYYGLIYSKVQYGIISWGTASKTSLNAIQIRLNQILRAISFNNVRTPVTSLYKNLNFLKLDDIYKLELAKFMYKVYNKNLPKIIENKFTKLASTHEYNTRQSAKSGYFRPRVNKSIASNLLSFRGPKLFNEIDYELKSMQWVSFKKNYKKQLLNRY